MSPPIWSLGESYGFAYCGCAIPTWSWHVPYLGFAQICSDLLTSYRVDLSDLLIRRTEYLDVRGSLGPLVSPPPAAKASVRCGVPTEVTWACFSCPGRFTSASEMQSTCTRISHAFANHVTVRGLPEYLLRTYFRSAEYSVANLHLYSAWGKCSRHATCSVFGSRPFLLETLPQPVAVERLRTLYEYSVRSSYRRPAIQ